MVIGVLLLVHQGIVTGSSGYCYWVIRVLLLGHQGIVTGSSGYCYWVIRVLLLGHQGIVSGVIGIFSDLLNQLWLSQLGHVFYTLVFGAEDWILGISSLKMLEKFQAELLGGEI